MRNIGTTQEALQLDLNVLPSYKVEIKESELAADITYEDITEIVSDGGINRNLEGKPNTATLRVANTEGQYDIVKVTSANSKKFKAGAKVKISLGLSTANILLFTGYVKEGYKPRYKKDSKETITVRLQCRAAGTHIIDYTKNNVTTIEFSSAVSWDGGSELQPSGTKWSVKRILEWVLVEKGGMDINDIVIHADLDLVIVDKAQFIKESVWGIVQLCCQTRMQAGYFDVDGTFKTQPWQFSNIDLDMSGTSNSDYEAQIDHDWRTNELISEIVVLGGMKYSGRKAEKKTIFDVDPWTTGAARGQKDLFESQSGGTGNKQYDSLYGLPGLSESLKKYGIGMQGSIVPEYGFVLPIVGYIDLIRWWEDAGDGFGINDESKWTKVVQGPFKWSLQGVPNEPGGFGAKKGGIGDGADMGATGYFLKYNQSGGTNVEIDPSTLSVKWDGAFGQFPEIIGGLFNDWEDTQHLHGHYGILRSEEEWNRMWEASYDTKGYPKFAYPAVGAAPTTEEYYTYTYVCWDAGISYTKWPDDNSREYNLCKEIENTAWQWGMRYTADWTEIPAEHWTGTHVDPELFGIYGKSKLDTLKNPLLFGTTECEYVGSKLVEHLKFFHIQTGAVIEQQLQLEPGDVIDYLDKRLNVIERLAISNIKYKFGKERLHTVDFRGGLISSNGTTVKAYI